MSLWLVLLLAPLPWPCASDKPALTAERKAWPSAEPENAERAPAFYFPIVKVLSECMGKLP